MKRFYYMRRCFLLLALCCLVNSICLAQSNESDDLFARANTVLYDNPTESVQIGTHLLLTSASEEEKAQIEMMLAKANFVLGNYSHSIRHVQSAIASAKKSRKTKVLFEASLLAAELYAFLDLFELSENYRNQAVSLSDGTPKEGIALRSFDLFVKDENPTSKRLIAFMDSVGRNSFEYSHISAGTPLLVTAQAFLKDGQVKAASEYFAKNLSDVTGNRRGIFWQISALIYYSDVFTHEKNYAETISTLEKALVYAKKIGNPNFQMQIYERLSAATLASGNKSNFTHYRKLASAAKDDHSSRIRAATNLAFEHQQKENSQNLLSVHDNERSNLSILIAITVTLLLIWIAVKFTFRVKIQHLRDSVNYLRLIKTINTKPEPAKTTGKALAIPKETEDLLLAKLDKFEAGKKYLSKDFSLAQMASIFETNTKYLSEIINKYKKKNFNTYINELRIAHIIDKLQNDPNYLNYKVSYLAEECGFSSHSIFTAAFKNVTGITPNTFISFQTENAKRVISN